MDLSYKGRRCDASFVVYLNILLSKQLAMGFRRHDAQVTSLSRYSPNARAIYYQNYTDWAAFIDNM